MNARVQQQYHISSVSVYSAYALILFISAITSCFNFSDDTRYSWRRKDSILANDKFTNLINMKQKEKNPCRLTSETSSIILSAFVSNMNNYLSHTSSLLCKIIWIPEIEKLFFSGDKVLLNFSVKF